MRTPRITLGLIASKRKLSICSTPRDKADEQDIDVIGQFLQRLMRGGNHLQGADVGDKPTAGPERFVGGFEESDDLAAVAADEHGIRFGQIDEHLRRGAVNRFHIRDAEGVGIGDDQVIVGGIFFNGIDRAGRHELSHLDGDRTGTRTDIPGNVTGTQIELRQSNRPHFGLSDQAGLGPTLREEIISIAETPQLGPNALTIGSIRFATQNHHVERIEAHILDFVQLAAGDPLIPATEVLADVTAKIVDTASEQFPGNAVGCVGIAGEQPDGLGDADFVDDVLQSPRGEIGEVGFLPGFLDAGEGQLHGTDVRHHFKMIAADLVAEITGRAVK